MAQHEYELAEAFLEAADCLVTLANELPRDPGLLYRAVAGGEGFVS
jgi:hypothetical protein